MKNLHAKSPCCQGEINKFGSRRRQCGLCGKTWRIRRKKTGRKRRRESQDFLFKYLRHEVPSLYALARFRKISKNGLYRRLERSLNGFLKHASWSPMPVDKPLVALTDAMVQLIDSKVYTIYFILLRPINETRATIVMPYISSKTETWSGWQEAFRRLPNRTKKQILAMVCDGHCGLTSLAKQHKWILQRCQFHLLARLQAYCSKFTLSRHYQLGKSIYKQVTNILENPDEEKIAHDIQILKAIAKTVHSRGLKRTLSGFVKHYRDYRTYLYYPHLYLPKTNNAAESLIGGIRNFLHRARGFRTLRSLARWIEAFLKNKQKATCNGVYQPRKRE